MIAVAEKLHGSIIDETGNRYGRLTVLEYAGRGNRRALWKCVCDCGTDATVEGKHLHPRLGITASCGCLQKELRNAFGKPLKEGEASFNYLLRNIENGAKSRGYVFNLTKEHVRGLVTKPCHYCGNPPSQIANNGGGCGTFTYSGIDRTDNTLGYVEGNVVPCCKTCNFAKRTMRVEEFKAWLTRAYKHFVEGQNK